MFSMYMKKISTCLFFASLVFSNSGFADHGKHHSGHHDHGKHHSSGHHNDKNHNFEFSGSFVGLRGTTPDDAVMDQYIFDEDGTVYHEQSTALGFPNTTQTHGADVGTWEFKDGFIYATLIGYTADSTTVGSCCDVNIASYSRDTEKYKVIDKDTLEVQQRVFRTFTLSENPLTDEGTVRLDSRRVFLLKRVKVLRSDI